MLASLWMPWYAISLKGILHDTLTEKSTRLPPALSELAKGLVQVMPKNIRGTGWQAFAGADIALAGGAALVVLAIVMAAGAGGSGVRVAPAVAGRLALGAGLAMTALVLVKVMNPVGPNDIVTVETGAWLALGGSILVAVGGLLASHPHGVEAHVMAQPVGTPSWAGHSMAPPKP